MDEKHTPGPWHFKNLHVYSGNDHSLDGQQKNAITMGGCGCSTYWDDGVNTEANARRIVACVNACEGISTERLKTFSGAKAYKSVITLTADNLDLKKQRDELLEALKQCVTRLAPAYKGLCFERDALAAIAKAEDGAA